MPTGAGKEQYSEIISTAVIVMAKVPQAGKVKTRLAVELGFPGAAQLAEAFLLDTLEIVCAGSEIFSLTPYLACSPEKIGLPRSVNKFPLNGIFPQRF